MFHNATCWILNRLFSELPLASPVGSRYADHCDLWVPDAVGVELKGSARFYRLPNGQVMTLDRPGMMRSDTEKKAASNATTFKADLGATARFYVLTNAVPIAWQEEHPSIDEIYDVGKRADLETFADDIRDDARRASRDQRPRR